MGDVKKILVTGAAGFIGYHLCERLLKDGHAVLGLDNINDYYEPELKYARLREIGIEKREAEKFGNISNSNIHGKRLKFIRLNLEDRKNLPELFEKFNFDIVCNLAAQAGVRYSLENPNAYIDSNISGFLNILECCRQNNIDRLIYASSSSVYGNSTKVPFEESDIVNQPISLYAATKLSNELMAHTYSHLFNFQTVGLRFFTVYGPWGRPDMAMLLFTDAIYNNKPIEVFNVGNLARDFTYIDDIIEGINSTIINNSKIEKQSKVYNIGNSKPIKLLDFIEALENELGKKAEKILLPMQPGDVDQTWASTEKLEKDYKYQSKTSICEGIEKFVDWYRKYYVVKDNLSSNDKIT